MAPETDAPKLGFLRLLASEALSRKRESFTLLGAAVVAAGCIVALLTAAAHWIWIGPLAAALLTAAFLTVIWELHWKRGLVEEIFLRFHPPSKVPATDRFFSPLTLFTYEEAKRVCQCGPDAMQLSLICAENARIQMRDMRFSADGNFFEFVAEIRENEKIVKAAEQVKIAFDKIAGKLRPLAAGRAVSPILDALTSVPDFLDKLSALMASAVIPLAHYLSSSDQAKKLREINKKLGVIFEHRSIDQESELKSIYQQAAEALSSQSPIYATERFDPHKLALGRLQNVWMKEIRLTLDSAVDVRKGWVFRRKHREGQYCQHVLAIASKLQLFQLAFFTHLCLAHATETLREFYAITLKGNIAEFEGISTLCSQLHARLVHTDLQSYSHAHDIQQATGVLLAFLQSIQNQSGDDYVVLKAEGA
jgi:hypothetical protein